MIEREFHFLLQRTEKSVFRNLTELSVQPVECETILYTVHPYFFLSYFNKSIDSFTLKDVKQKKVFTPYYTGLLGLCTDFHDKIIQVIENLFSLDLFKTSEAH